jgi:hypothetical protein
MQNRMLRWCEVAEAEGWRAKRAEDEQNRGKARKKGHEAPLGEANLSEQKEDCAAKAVLSRRQPERGGKAFWDAEQLDRDLASRWSMSIASQSRLSTRGESGLAAHGKGPLPLCVAKLGREAAGSPRYVGVA